MKSTVPRSISDSSSSAAIGVRRHSVAHRRRRVAVARAEVALAVDQRIAQREVLRHPHHGVVTLESPCGWYLPITSPTARRLHVLGWTTAASSFIANRMRRCARLQAVLDLRQQRDFTTLIA